jgi:hypothetical protein
LLKSGAMTVGYSTSITRLNATQANQAHSHHRPPDEPMIHRINAASGSPMTAPTAAPLSRSSSHSRVVMRLKPWRCSTRKVEYQSSGSSMRLPITTKAVSKASW